MSPIWGVCYGWRERGEHLRSSRAVSWSGRAWRILRTSTILPRRTAAWIAGNSSGNTTDGFGSSSGITTDSFGGSSGSSLDGFLDRIRMANRVLDEELGLLAFVSRPLKRALTANPRRSRFLAGTSLSAPILSQTYAASIVRYFAWIPQSTFGEGLGSEAAEEKGREAALPSPSRPPRRTPRLSKLTCPRSGNMQAAGLNHWLYARERG